MSGIKQVHIMVRQPEAIAFFTAGEDFNLTGYVTSVRAVGYAMSETFYIPLDNIAGIFVAEGTDNPPVKLTPIKGGKE